MTMPDFTAAQEAALLLMRAGRSDAEIEALTALDAMELLHLRAHAASVAPPSAPPAKVGDTRRSTTRL